MKVVKSPFMWLGGVVVTQDQGVRLTEPGNPDLRSQTPPCRATKI